MYIIIKEKYTICRKNIKDTRTAGAAWGLYWNRRKITMSLGKLGFGLMRLPVNSEDPTDIDLEQLKNMVDIFMEKGLTNAAWNIWIITCFIT